MAHPVLRLKKGEERRLLAGHMWVFGNEVDTRHTPLKELSPGQIAMLQSARGENLGTAYANPHSLICERLCSRTDDALSADWFRARLRQALALTTAAFSKPFYRLVHAEGDLSVDCYRRLPPLHL